MPQKIFIYSVVLCQIGKDKNLFPVAADAPIYLKNKKGWLLFVWYKVSKVQVSRAWKKCRVKQETQVHPYVLTVPHFLACFITEHKMVKLFFICYM